MYFPYLRGRQYELLALKEMIQKNILDQNVVPVIEPVKISSTFQTTMALFQKEGHRIGLVINPEVGEMSQEWRVEELLPYLQEEVIPAFLMNESIESLRDSSILKSEREKISIIRNRDESLIHREVIGEDFDGYSFFPDDRRIERMVSGKKVLLNDKFHKKPRNADYEQDNDEFFSDDHLFFKEEGLSGFGDYSIIGEAYDEGGFTPRAVAIHIVYFDRDNGLRIHHFVSNSKYGTEDVAGKFYEAVKKLENWYKMLPEEERMKQTTDALDTLLQYAKTGYYPGLPTLKKLSIMHHLQLIGNYLSMEIESR